MKKRALSILLSMVMAAGLFAGCGGGSGASSAPASSGADKTSSAAPAGDAASTAPDAANAAPDAANAASGGVTTVYMEGEPTTLDFSKVSGSDDTSIGMETMEGLTRYIDDKIQPAGATSWDVSEDGLVYTFHLRDYNWSDGKPVTADDFVYAFQRLFAPEVACPNAAIFYCVAGGEAYNTGKGTAEDVGAKAVDEKTFEVTLSKPVPYFIELTKFVACMPMRRDIIEPQGDAYGTDVSKMVFCGPFVVDSWVKGSQIVLKKNAAYYAADSIKIDTINMPLVSDDMTRQQMFDTGGVDVIKKVQSQYMEIAAPRLESGDIWQIKTLYPSTGYLAFNTQDAKGIFTNAKVRRAFSLAIDREAYVTNVVRKDTAGYGFIPHSVAVGDAGDFRTNTPEPLAAQGDTDVKALFEEGIAELGLTGQPIEVQYLQSNANPDTQAVGEFFMDQWQKKLGVTVTIDTAGDNADFNSRKKTGNFQITSGGWGGDYNDPMTFMQLFVTGDGNNTALFTNARYDELIEQCMVEQDQKKRMELFAEAEDILVNQEAAIAPLTYNIANNFVNKRLQGIQMSAGGPQYEMIRAFIQE